MPIIVGLPRSIQAYSAVPASVKGGTPDSMWHDAICGRSSKCAAESSSGIFSAVFVDALTRFLVNYDALIREWWISQASLVPEKSSDKKTREIRASQLNELASSVLVGLNRFDSSTGAASLFKGLVESCGNDNREAIRQLCVIFTLLDASNQPVALIDEQLFLFDPSAEAQEGSDVREGAAAVVFPQDRSLVGLPAKPRLLKRPDGTFQHASSASSTTFPASFDFALGSTNQRRRRSTPPVSREKSLGASTFSRFFLAGACASGFAHSALTPLDMLKTRLQAQPDTYSDGPFAAAKAIYEKEGAGAFVQGLGPTAAGYVLAGAVAFGGTELLKRAAVAWLGPQLVLEHSFLVVLACGAAAVSVCVLVVAPFEATRIRLVQEPSLCASQPLVQTVKQVLSEGNVYRGVPALLVKEVPFHATKFAVFDSTSSVLQATAALSTWTPTALTVVAGVAAGVVAAVVSQPADATFTRCNQQAADSSNNGGGIGRGGGGGDDVPEALSPNEAFADLVKERALLVGLSSRCVFGGCLVALQFTAYDALKAALHVAPSDLTLYLDALSRLPSS